MASRRARLQPSLIGIAEIGIDIDVHATDQVVLEGKDTAEAPLGDLAIGPCRTIPKAPTLGSFHHDMVIIDDIMETLDVVDQLGDLPANPSSELDQRSLARCRPELGK